VVVEVADALEEASSLGGEVEESGVDLVDAGSRLVFLGQGRVDTVVRDAAGGDPDRHQMAAVHVGNGRC
jgi:hypothetical protein